MEENICVKNVAQYVINMVPYPLEKLEFRVLTGAYLTLQSVLLCPHWQLHLSAILVSSMASGGVTT